jgi:hypothetical protein
MRGQLFLVIVVALVCSLAAVCFRPAAADEASKDTDKEKLAAKAYTVLKENCSSCHHDKKNGNDDYDILSYESLTKTKPSDEVKEDYPKVPAYVTPDKPSESLIWVRVEKGEMPPKKAKKKPSKEDKETLQAWIKAGAPKEGFSSADK